MGCVLCLLNLLLETRYQVMFDGVSIESRKDILLLFIFNFN